MQDRSDKVEQVQNRYSKPPQGEVTMNKLLLIIVLTIAVSVMAVNFLFLGNYVSKADDTRNITAMNDAITKTKSELTQTVVNLQNTMNALPTSIAGQVNSSIAQTTSTLNAQISSMQSQVNNMASVVKSASDKADQLNSTVSGLSTKIDALTEQLADAEDRIAALEAKIIPSTTSSSGITAKIKSTSSVLSASSNTTLVGSFRLTLTNSTAVDVTDIILDITTQTDAIMGTHTVYLTGGGTSWQRQGYDPTYTDFVNATWGLKVPANSTVTGYLTLTIVDSGTVDYLVRYGSTGVPYTVDVSVQ